MSLSKRLRPDIECAPWVIEEVRKLEFLIEDLVSDINDYQNIIDEQLRELEQLRPPKKISKEESFARMAIKWRTGKIMKEKKDAELKAQGICPDCEGEGQMGGQFTGGYWDCEACNGTGLYSE